MNSQGIYQWTLDTNKPLISSYYSEIAFEENPAPLITTLSGEVVEFVNGNFIKLRQNIKDLVERPPDYVGNRIYIGEKSLRAYILDKASGDILGYYENSQQYSQDKTSETITIGLVNYMYSVLDANTMNTIYNISYTELLTLHKTINIHKENPDFFSYIQNIDGAITALHSFDSSGELSKEIYVPEFTHKIKLNNVGNNMIYAELVDENIDGKNVFALTHEPLLMIEGQVEETIYWWWIFLVFIPFLYYLLRKKKTVQVMKSEAAVETVEVMEKKKIELFVDKILGHGSQGTTVFEGMFQERPVAVKRMLKNCIKEAKQEVSLLIKADAHPNVVTFFAWEEDDTFVYLAFEKCVGTLADVVTESIKKKKKGLKIKKTSEIIKLLHDSALGLSYLHKLNIVHRDIKPMNILIDSKNIAKIADMASGKRLAKDASSFGTQAHGSSGWQPKEVLTNQRRTKAVDIFSLGCTFFYSLTKGGHPFGSRIQRDNNILSSNFSLKGISQEAKHLIEKMIQMDSSKRPQIDYIHQHCLFWSTQVKLNFLQDVSDLLEAEGNGSLLEIELECYCKIVMDKPWDEVLGVDFIANLGKYRKYNHSSVKDLLRVIRNKMHHFHDMPEPLKVLVGPMPDGFFAFFDKKFPLLFITLFDYLEISGNKLISKYIKI